MKGIKILAGLVVIFCCFLAACNQDEDNNYNYTYNYEPCCTDGTTAINDGDTTINSGLSLVLLADLSVGRSGMITIYKKSQGGDTLMVDIPILVTDGGQFGFDLEPGEYWVTVTGTAFTSYADFTVMEEEYYLLVLQMYEWPLISWYASLDSQSPAGPRVLGNGIEVMRFSLRHDWPYDLQPEHFTFEVHYTLNLNINVCYLSWYDPGSGFYENLGAAPVTDYQVTFPVDPNLPQSTIEAGMSTTYKLSCDIMGNPNNDVVQASLVNFLANPTTTAQHVWTLPLWGNLLTF